MAENTKIAWAHCTFNPWIGCSRVSPGCENCYAENLMDNRYHKVEWGPGKPRQRTKTWNDPLRWDRWAADGTCYSCHGRGTIVTKKRGVRLEDGCAVCGAAGNLGPYRIRVFCASLADWLDAEVPPQWREDLCQLIERCTNIDWLMLTKRPQNAACMLPNHWWEKPLPNVWFGVTAESQKWWDIRVPQMMAIPAALRWVSYEPALGPLTIPGGGQVPDWLIIGGESEQTMPAREFHVEWATSAVEQCRDRGIVPFVKQKGTNVFMNSVQLDLKSKAGSDMSEWPAACRVREFPKSILSV